MAAIQATPDVVRQLTPRERELLLPDVAAYVEARNALAAATERLTRMVKLLPEGEQDGLELSWTPNLTTLQLVRSGPARSNGTPS